MVQALEHIIAGTFIDPREIQAVQMLGICSKERGLLGGGDVGEAY